MRRPHWKPLPRRRLPPPRMQRKSCWRASAAASRKSSCQRRQNRNQNRQQNHNGCINSRKACDEFLRLGFLCRCVFHHFQNLHHRRFAKAPFYTNLQTAVHIDAAAEYLISCPHRTGQGFACQCRSIQHCMSFRDYPVQRDSFSCLYQNHIPHLHQRRVYLPFLIIHD